ncbi:MAG: HIT family protein [Candidatus Pacebacteria bacterium]|nr:HIT family protein [Candidatus Paceibacterota bacterium]
MEPATESIFDKIIKREIPAEIVYEDDTTIAFLDIHPNNPGHTLVVPKKPFKNLFDMDEAALTNLIKAVQKVAIAIKDGMRADGINIAMNNDAAAGQIVFHAHMHVIPRFKDDGFKHFPTKEYAPGEAAVIAEKIRTQLP